MTRRLYGPAAIVVALVLVSGFALAACGSSSKVATGIVTDIQEASLADVTGFTLRTQDGRNLVFTIGRLELDGNAFNAGHLQVHRLSAEPIAVAYREEGGNLVAYRLVDAPWAQ